MHANPAELQRQKEPGGSQGKSKAQSGAKRRDFLGGCSRSQSPRPQMSRIARHLTVSRLWDRHLAGAGKAWPSPPRSGTGRADSHTLRYAQSDNDTKYSVCRWANQKKRRERSKQRIVPWFSRRCPAVTTLLFASFPSSSEDFTSDAAGPCVHNEKLDLALDATLPLRTERRCAGQ